MHMGIKNTYFLGIIFPPSPFVGTGVLRKIHSTVIRQYVLRICRRRGKIILRFYGKMFYGNHSTVYRCIYNKHRQAGGTGKGSELSELREYSELRELSEYSDNLWNCQIIQNSQTIKEIVRQVRKQG